MWKIVVLTLLVLVCTSEARRGGGGGRRGGGGRGRARVRGAPPNAENVSVWNRTLVTELAKEISFTLPDNADQIFVVSGQKKQLAKENYKKSKTLYDFSNGVAKVLVKVKKWCFLLNKPEDLTKEAVLQQLAAYNGQDRAATAPVAMYATDLDDAATTELQGRSGVSAMCGTKPIRGLSADAPTDPDAQFLSVLVTVPDEHISINVPRRSRAGGRRRNKGGKRRNRQN